MDGEFVEVDPDTALWAVKDHGDKTCASEGCTNRQRYCGYCSRHHRDLQHSSKGGWEEARRHLGAIPAAVRREVMASGPCVYCGGPAEEADHLVPVINGGTHDRANLVPACHACNVDRNSYPVLVWRDRARVLHALAASEKVRALAYDALSAVRQLHRLKPVPGSPPRSWMCQTCGVPYPCPTSKAVRGLPVD